MRHRGNSKTDPFTGFIWLSRSEQNLHRQLITVVISSREKNIQEALFLPAGWRMLYSRWGLRMYSKGRDGDEGACVYVCVLGGWGTPSRPWTAVSKEPMCWEIRLVTTRRVWVGIGLWEWIVFCFLTRCWVHMGSCFVLIPQAVQVWCMHLSVSTSHQCYSAGGLWWDRGLTRIEISALLSPLGRSGHKNSVFSVTVASQALQTCIKQACRWHQSIDPTLNSTCYTLIIG